MLTVKNLKFSYRTGIDILKQVSFSLENGKLLAILGNNGVGKSTMLKCFNRILHAKQGQVWLNNENLLEMSHREIAKRVAFVAQNISNTQMTVHDVVMLGRRPYMRWGFTAEDHKIVHEVMERLHLTAMRGRFFNELSGGERQKVMLARALAQQPQILLLDEPTSSLDLQNQYQVLGIIQRICHETNISAVMVIHDLNLALRFCDQFLFLKDGGVYDCGDIHIVNRTALHDVYGINADIKQINNQTVVLVD